MTNDSLIGKCVKCEASASIMETDAVPQFLGKPARIAWLPKIKYSIIANACQHDVRFNGSFKHVLI